MLTVIPDTDFCRRARSRRAPAMTRACPLEAVPLRHALSTIAATSTPRLEVAAQAHSRRRLLVKIAGAARRDRPAVKVGTHGAGHHHAR